MRPWGAARGEDAPNSILQPYITILASIHYNPSNPTLGIALVYSTLIAGQFVDSAPRHQLCRLPKTCPRERGGWWYMRST